MSRVSVSRAGTWAGVARVRVAGGLLANRRRPRVAAGMMRNGQRCSPVEFSSFGGDCTIYTPRARLYRTEVVGTRSSCQHPYTTIPAIPVGRSAAPVPARTGTGLRRVGCRVTSSAPAGTPVAYTSCGEVLRECYSH